jgi:transposase-like protein
MNSYDWGNGAANRSREAAVTAIPTACPACRSNSIATTARNPDDSAYWRCGSCGEIWNASRREVRRRGADAWR